MKHLKEYIIFEAAGDQKRNILINSIIPYVGDITIPFVDNGYKVKVERWSSKLHILIYAFDRNCKFLKEFKSVKNEFGERIVQERIVTLPENDCPICKKNESIGWSPAGYLPLSGIRHKNYIVIDNDVENILSHLFSFLSEYEFIINLKLTDSVSNVRESNFELHDICDWYSETDGMEDINQIEFICDLPYKGRGCFYKEIN